VTKHLRILTPAENVLAFYDGRVEGYRFAEGANWVDDGALSLGIASYAVIDGDHALVYDTHVTLDHARAVRQALEERGARKFTVVLSHWHLDHIAGNAIFSDCEIIGNARTAEHLASRKAAIESGTHEGPPAIAPLVLPTRTFSGRMTLKIGGLDLELIEADIHSDDATVVWLAGQRLLLAGDTMEDTVTYVVEPEGLDRHLADLDRLAGLDPARILPNHGDPDRIAAGGYAKSFIRATQQYIRALKRTVSEEDLRQTPLKELVAGPLQAGWISYYAPYEDIHRGNVETVMRAAAAP
jgi:glyoxylase-like metal-dependent hydrolase (beta-lactamase superfamily II)